VARGLNIGQPWFSGYSVYPSFNINKFCSLSRSAGILHMILKRRAILAYTVLSDWFISQEHYVCCAVKTECLNIIDVNLMLRNTNCTFGVYMLKVIKRLL